ARPTTPALNDLAQRGELMVFQDAVTSHASTGLALIDALTWRTADGTRRTLIDVFNDAGFKTYWLSNQPSVGVFDSMFSLLTHSATSHVWLNQKSEPVRSAEGLRSVGAKNDSQIVDTDIKGWKFPLNERQRTGFDDRLLPVLS